MKRVFLFFSLHFSCVFARALSSCLVCVARSGASGRGALVPRAMRPAASARASPYQSHIAVCISLAFSQEFFRISLN